MQKRLIPHRILLVVALYTKAGEFIGLEVVSLRWLLLWLPTCSNVGTQLDGSIERLPPFENIIQLLKSSLAIAHLLGTIGAIKPVIAVIGSYIKGMGISYDGTVVALHTYAGHAIKLVNISNIGL